jgi:selenocysteine-specific elongation factor
MAGHIDHGKTTLTKALTGVDTDRLKEEKERQISIEPGFAPFKMDDGSIVSIIDVPGHERFIRQMIAGVAGIDLVILAVAADEGVMPQTKEHLEILKFLQVKKGIVAITKKDKVEADFLELVKEEILDELENSIFQYAPVVYVDSPRNQGIHELRAIISDEIRSLQSKGAAGSFRLPIDQVFSIKGQGTIVRGTIMEGSILTGQPLDLLPRKISVKARQLQVHGNAVKEATAGQRVAVNLPNISTGEVQRGDVLVHSNTYDTTDTIDVNLQFVTKLNSPVKQRSILKVHIGTAEVPGTIVFFDRKECTGEMAEEVLCQIRLNEEITAKRGDKFIVRRPSPAETVGGGWVIQAKGTKYKFGEETIRRLEKVKEGSPQERLNQAFAQSYLLSSEEIQREIGAAPAEAEKMSEKVAENLFTSQNNIMLVQKQVKIYLEEYHQTNPLKAGIPKAELLSSLTKLFPTELVDFILGRMEGNKEINRIESLIALTDFYPAFPRAWKKRMEQAVQEIEGDGLKPKPYLQYCEQAGLPENEARDLHYYLIHQQIANKMDEKHLISVKAFQEAVEILKENYPDEMELADIKETLDLSRKYLIPFVELMDSLGITNRLETKRKWN